MQQLIVLKGKGKNLKVKVKVDWQEYLNRFAGIP